MPLVTIIARLASDLDEGEYLLFAFKRVLAARHDQKVVRPAQFSNQWLELWRDAVLLVR